MPIFKEIHSDDNHIAIWQIDESEDVLLRELGQSVDLPENPRRRLERLAVLNLIKQLGLGDKYHYQPDGRPYLPTNDSHISISHSGNKVVVAVNPIKPIGVDIEQTERDYKRVAQKFMSHRELSRLADYGANEFSLIWCVKEAVYKLPWGVYKSFSTEVDVQVEVDMQYREWCTVKVKHNGEWNYLRANFEYLDNYCLVWVNQ